VLAVIADHQARPEQLHYGRNPEPAIDPDSAAPPDREVLDSDGLGLARPWLPHGDLELG